MNILNDTIITLSEEEHEILAMYMARLDNAENHSVHFCNDDLTSILGDNFTAQRIHQCLTKLMSTVVSSNNNTIAMATLFDSARVYRDDDEQLCMDLTCTPTAHTYFFSDKKNQAECKE